MQSGKQKVAQICELLKEKTIEPAQVEAKKIIEDAKRKADQIIADADTEKQKRLDQADAMIKQKKKTFEASLKLSATQCVDQLKETLMERFFSKELKELIEKGSSSPKVISQLIQTVVEGMQKEGIDGDTLAYKIDKNDIISEILTKYKDRLKVEGDIDILGGVIVKFIDQNLRIDVSDQALKDMVASYIHEDFRRIIFAI